MCSHRETQSLLSLRPNSPPKKLGQNVEGDGEINPSQTACKDKNCVAINIDKRIEKFIEVSSYDCRCDAPLPKQFDSFFGHLDWTQTCFVLGCAFRFQLARFPPEYSWQKFEFEMHSVCGLSAFQHEIGKQSGSELDKDIYMHLFLERDHFDMFTLNHKSDLQRKTQKDTVEVKEQ